MYIRYIHKLYDLHLKAQNYTGTDKAKTLAPFRPRCCGSFRLTISFSFCSHKFLSRRYSTIAPDPSCFPRSGPTAASMCILFCLCITEASYTLLLYDELLEWSDRPLREFLNYPMQSEWQRKEYLHLTIIQNFDRGKVSEHGITVTKKKYQEGKKMCLRY